jgi:hypothetical protein
VLLPRDAKKYVEEKILTASKPNLVRPHEIQDYYYVCKKKEKAMGWVHWALK